MHEVLPEISIAPQEAILFDGSFQMNIGMGNDFDMEIASKFIKALSLDKIKNDWPLDLNSAESIRTFFSGGELQRISILRALLKPADIYIFDEPTSSLDRNRANNFFKLLRNFYKKKLIIIISHSNEDLLQCDEVVRVKNKNAYLLSR